VGILPARNINLVKHLDKPMRDLSQILTLADGLEAGVKTVQVRSHLQHSEHPHEVRKPEEVTLQGKGELEPNQPLPLGFAHIREKIPMPDANKKA
jgi:hypothetical protein